MDGARGNERRHESRERVRISVRIPVLVEICQHQARPQLAADLRFQGAAELERMIGGDQ